MLKRAKFGQVQFTQPGNTLMTKGRYCSPLKYYIGNNHCKSLYIMSLPNREETHFDSFYNTSHCSIIEDIIEDLLNFGTIGNFKIKPHHIGIVVTQRG